MFTGIFSFRGLNLRRYETLKYLVIISNNWYNLKITCAFLFLDSSFSFPQLFLDFSFPHWNS
ncbi:hypothetical protein BpHYR1_028768 [Brachionus plicatilis]|uniref:Uncharacterized protein n=1 Tax=Brachionus plicatilis TaxID=10195 RepID=A0A3M7RSM0_BRAPC|nr:hypothetical protein BpHYR1_028768 [Brachionus plicatilis]